LLTAALALPPENGLRRWTYYTLFGLFAIDLQPMLARSVDDGIIGEDIGKGRRILAFYENTNTFLVGFRDGHLEVITEHSGSHIVGRGLDWKPMASGPDDYHYDPADDGDNIDQGFFVFDDISEDMATDNRLVSGNTFLSAGQFARRNQDIAQQQGQQKRPLAQRTFGPSGSTRNGDKSRTAAFPACSTSCAGKASATGGWPNT
jgi:hypothetical protein